MSYHQPPAKSGMGAGKIIGIGCAGFIVLGVMGVGCAAIVSTADTSGSPSSSSDTASSSASEEPSKTPVEEFQECIEENGTPPEVETAEHITRVTGAEDGEILGMAEVFTDYTGGMAGPHQGDGTLIASVFAVCYESSNGDGLVTVYDETGEILSNGNF